MKKNALFFIIVCALLSGCISPEERAASKNRMNSILNQQCSVTMGFKQGTKDYMNCRMFYDDVLRYQGIDITYMSLTRVDRFRVNLEDLNQTCMQYLGNFKPKAGEIWECVHKKEKDKIDEAIRKQQLKEQEEMQQRAISSALKEANDDARLQERIDAERNRVAAEKGVRPSDVTCKTYHKRNDYIQVKCK